ncbi:hypothetical protein E2C01_019108 [Portunus trituberculatus]|uniref:Secreted protein n=1 Tax=Portunus trituberculatus TaxID=210409 RepID=A0A5B7DWC5_PORTR|nr:hypothetical protein [Portunus trituberculatus]
MILSNFFVFAPSVLFLPCIGVYKQVRAAPQSGMTGFCQSLETTLANLTSSNFIHKMNKEGSILAEQRANCAALTQIHRMACTGQ